jgi:hypothetical protein
MTDILFDYIERVEGKNLHRNSTEYDVTSPGGIYRAEHPNASIWKYVDEVGASLNKDPDSANWSKSDLAEIDRHLDPERIKELVKEFYDEYLKGAHLELFDPLLQVAMFNIYTNTQTGAWKSVQQTVIDMNKMGLLDLPKNDISKVDGGFGGMTKRALIAVDNLPDSSVITFKIILISNMKTNYARLVVSNPPKYLQYLNGWMNRMDALEIA